MRPLSPKMGFYEIVLEIGRNLYEELLRKNAKEYRKNATKKEFYSVIGCDVETVPGTYILQ